MFKEKNMTAFDLFLLHCIERRRDTEALNVLINLSDPGRLVDNTGRTLLHYAAETGNDTVAKYLIESGTNIDAQDCYGKTPLMFYRKSYYDLRVCDILLNAHANIYIRDVNGKCAFQLLPERMRERIVYKLNEHCSGDTAKLAATLIDWQSSISCTIGLKNAELTRILLAHGCPVETSDGSWPTTTTLIQAVLCEYTDNVKVLLEHGVDVNAVCPTGSTALSVIGHQVVNRDRRHEILRLLLDRGADPTQIIGSGVRRGRMQMYIILSCCDREPVRVLLERDIDMYARDANGRNAVHYIASNAHPDVILELEGRKYDVNARDNENKTPLHHNYSFSVTTAEYLLDRGADVNAKDAHGITPLMKVWLAIDVTGDKDRIQQGRVKRLFELLLQWGADLQARTANQEYANFPVGEFELCRVQPVLVHLALLEARGIPIEPVIQYKINGHALSREYFRMCKQQLEEMKQVRVWKSITLHKLMIANQRKLECYVRNEQLLLNLRGMKNKNEYVPHYIYVLRDRVAKAVLMARMKTRSAAVLCEIIGWCPRSFGVVVREMIIKYLNESELRKICCEA